MRIFLQPLLLLMLICFPCAAQVLPKSPVPAQKMLLIDLKKEKAETKFLIHVLQGLVNRQQPRLYVVDDQYEGGQDAALHREMKDWGRETLASQGIEFREVTSTSELLEIFKESYRGGILYDKDVWTNPARAHVINGLTTECGLEDLLPVTDEMNKELKLRITGGAEGRWPEVRDFHYWMGSKNPALATATTTALVHKHPWSFYATDYAVANRIATFWVDKATFGTPRGRERLAKILTRTNLNTPILGVWQSWWPQSPEGSPVEGISELELLNFFSDHGKFLVPVVSPGNFTVHSGLQIAELKQKEISFRPLDKSKVYVTFLLSDGDNISGFSLIRPILWNQPERGTLPLGWNFSPAMLDLCPGTLKHFYDTATPNDYFVTACSGYGYVRADYGTSTSAGLQLLDNYLKVTGEYMRRADSQEIWNWWMNERTIRRYFEKLPFLTGMFIEPEPRTDEYENSFSAVTLPGQDGGKPVFHNFGSAAIGLKTEEMMTTWVKRVTSRIGTEKRPRFAFLGFNGFEAGPTRLSEFARRLPPNYVVVRPDEFIHLYQEAQKQSATEN